MTDRALIPDEVKQAVEEAVAAALDEPDLRAATERASRHEIPGNQNDIDLLVMLVPLLAASRLPRMWTESDTFRPVLDGYIVAAIQAQDLARGRDPAARTLKPYQREWLERYTRQAEHEAK